MNLEDYAYLDDGRWYVNPNVSLNEQNAFINNLRNLQAQDNAQIEQQTRGLGTQVPSQLGGLTGAGSYFRSRYQTPQTNLTVAELRSKMQNEALERVINNELAKGKKKYQDAYRAAQERSSNSNNNNNEPIYNQVIDGLNINAEGTVPDTGITPSEDVVRYNDVGQDKETGVMYYLDNNGQKWAVTVPTAIDAWVITGGSGRNLDIDPPYVGEIIEAPGGRKFVYTNNGWYRIRHRMNQED